MSTDYSYDEQGQFFPYFVVTLTALFTIPITYSALKPSNAPTNTAPRIHSDFRPGNADLIDNQRRKQKRRERKMKRLITAAIGWAVIAWMVYLMIVTARIIPKIWDPYDVLGIGRSATEKEITKHYRKLSITQHPDKKRPDIAKNETVQSINDDWVEITKAFKTLTDEEIRNNYIQFGHPDGKQSFSIGIALPHFLVTEGNGKYVLLLYGSLLGVLLPYLVGTWWYGTQKVTKEKVLISSAGALFKEYEEELSEAEVIAVLSSGTEFEETLSGSTSYDSVERKVLAEDSSDLKLTSSDRQNLRGMSDEQRRKILSLLWAYLGRMDLGDAILDEQKFQVAPIAQMLNDAFSTMIPLFGNTQPLLSSYHVSQALLQAVPPKASPLLQLPHFTPAIASAVEAGMGRKNATIQTFMNLPDQRRRTLSVGAGLLSASQYSTVVQVASQVPLVRVEKAFFKVTGERCITPGSLLQLVVKLRIIPPGTKDIPEVNSKDLLDIDPKEGDLDALHGRKNGEEADVPVQPPLVHAPYFARDFAPSWRIFLAENKSGKIAVPPFKFTEFNKPIFKDDGTPTFNVQTLKMQFQAPPQVNAYPFTMHMICDSYMGMDSQVDVIMKVEEMAQAEEIEDEDEISEPEEDSLAGQMNAMRGVNAGPKKASRRAVEAESSSGSDTEGEEDSESDSDTDTDTDEE